MAYLTATVCQKLKVPFTSTSPSYAKIPDAWLLGVDALAAEFESCVEMYKPFGGWVVFWAIHRYQDSVHLGAGVLNDSVGITDASDTKVRSAVTE